MPLPTLSDLQELVLRFQRARSWERFHLPKNIAMSVAIEAAELMEHFQWSNAEESLAYVADDANRREVADEMADVLIYLLSLAHHCQIDLAEAVVKKMARNETRFPVERYQV
jgi:NTP pyrophosphatase (non-canonical NTP hydrolase)